MRSMPGAEIELPAMDALPEVGTSRYGKTGYEWRESIRQPW